jgi:hypothetical protein
MADVETAVRIMAIVVGVLGAAVVVEGALHEYGRRTWALLGRLPILRRWYHRGVTVHVVGATATGESALAITASYGPFADDVSADERIEMLRVRINNVIAAMAGNTQDLRDEIRKSAAATRTHIDELKANLRELERSLTELQSDALRLNAEGIPLIVVGVVMGGLPWTDGAVGVVLLVAGGLVFARWAWGRFSHTP